MTGVRGAGAGADGAATAGAAFFAAVVPVAPAFAAGAFASEAAAFVAGAGSAGAGAAFAAGAVAVVFAGAAAFVVFTAWGTAADFGGATFAGAAAGFAATFAPGAGGRAFFFAVGRGEGAGSGFFTAGVGAGLGAGPAFAVLAAGAVLALPLAPDLAAGFLDAAAGGAGFFGGTAPFFAEIGLAAGWAFAWTGFLAGFEGALAAGFGFDFATALDLLMGFTPFAGAFGAFFAAACFGDGFVLVTVLAPPVDLAAGRHGARAVPGEIAEGRTGPGVKSRRPVRPTAAGNASGTASRHRRRLCRGLAVGWSSADTRSGAEGGI